MTLEDLSRILRGAVKGSGGAVDGSGGVAVEGS